MFEAKLIDGGVLKKIVEAIKDVVTDVNIDVSASGKYNNKSQIHDLSSGLIPRSARYKNCAKTHFQFTEVNLCYIVRMLTNLFVIGLSLQAMDGSHVALVSLNLSMEGFEHYRADTNMVLGLSVATLAKVMKLADSNDSITLQAEDNPSHLKLIFENPKTERVTEFTMNLISLD
jgi:hypothetical protein